MTTTAQYRNLLGYVFCSKAGIDLPLARHAIEAVRPIARRRDFLDVDDTVGGRRLDFESGREVSLP